MYKTIYIEEQVRDLALTKSILNRFSSANKVACDSYSEIFNRKSQDFRLQKSNPSLILAQKNYRHVLPAPAGYSLGCPHNYYFSVMMNCVYDCRYCFLQGMYRSAHHVLFVNYEDFADAIVSTARLHNDSDVWFFSGYDCDSLAMEPFAGVADFCLNLTQKEKNIWLELRTKSTQIRSLLNRSPINNVVVAFSMTPRKISEQLEVKVPLLSKRIFAIQQLQEAGWNVGIRIDPLIYASDYKQQYGELFEEVFSVLDVDLVHSVTYGGFRMPRDFFRTIERLYPDDKFIAQPFAESGKHISYPKRIEQEMAKWCLEELIKYIDIEKIYHATVEV